MDVITFRDYCLSFAAVTEGFPFGGDTLVFKVKGKMFCLAGIDDFEFINLKCDPDKALLLREAYPAVRPGYHMDKKHWNSVYMDGTVPDPLIRQWIADSYQLIVDSLPAKLRDELKGE